MLQSNNIILIVAIAISVMVLGIVFIRRAIRYRKNMKIVATHLEKSDTDSDSFYESGPSKSAEQNHYLLRFIYMDRTAIQNPKDVKIRDNYYKAIEIITQGIGKNKINIQGYIDNVLEAHLAENRDIIRQLHKESLQEAFKNKK